MRSVRDDTHQFLHKLLTFYVQVHTGKVMFSSLLTVFAVEFTMNTLNTMSIINTTNDQIKHDCPQNTIIYIQ